MNLWSFLRDRVLYIALYAGFGVVTVAIIELDLFFSGTTLRVANVLYLWLLGLVGLAGFLLVDYRKHVAFAKRLESISADEPLDRLGFLAEPRTLEQRVFANAWASLYARLRAELIEERNRGRHNVELVSQWAHHMKSPVSVIDLELQRASQMDMSAELAEVVLSVGEENQRLNNSIQMLLNMVRLEDFAADFASEQVDLLALVRQLINDNRRMFITHRVFPKVLLDEGDTSGWSCAVSDSKWLRFAIQQVISNAIKYSSRVASRAVYDTPAADNGGRGSDRCEGHSVHTVSDTPATDDGAIGAAANAAATDGRDTSAGDDEVTFSRRKGEPDGEVTFSCRKGETDGEVVLEIADNGIGIAAEDLGRVFDPFFTGANGRAFPQSTGMGLYLARQACLRLGHRISIESRPGAGTRVSIAFPADQTIFAGVNASVAQTGR